MPNPLDSADSARRDPYAAWQSSDYRRFALGWFALVFGKQIETVAVLVHIHAQNQSPLALGWIGLVQALPVLLLAVPGGQIADRLDRRRVMSATLAVSTLVALGLTLASLGHAPSLWIYGLLGVGAVSQALGGPARAALLPQLVAPQHFGNAVTWNTTVFRVASMIGPAAGGLIIGLQKNTATAFAAVVLCRLLSLAAILGLRGRPQDRSGESLSWDSLAAGIRFVWRTKLILATITVDLFAVLLGGATYLLPIFASDILRVGPRGVGFLQSAEAVGAVCMAMLSAHLPPMRHAGRTMLWAVAGFGAATIVFGLSTWFWLSMAMMLLIGAMDNVSVVVRHTLVQMLTPDAMRGRVSAVNGIFITASNDLGGLESGVAAGLLGLVPSVVMGGVGAILVVIAAARLWPEILSIGSLRDVHPDTMVDAEAQEMVLE
jgi:MFS family permease